MGTYYRLTTEGKACVSADDELGVVLRDELYGVRVVAGAYSLIEFPLDVHWLADEYVDAGLLECVEASGVDGATITYKVTAAHDGLFAVSSGESILAVVTRYSIARNIACYSVSANGGYCDVEVGAAPDSAAITHMDFIDYI